MNTVYLIHAHITYKGVPMTLKVVGNHDCKKEDIDVQLYRQLNKPFSTKFKESDVVVNRLESIRELGLGVQESQE